MKLKTIEEVNGFLNAVNACKGDVWVQSQYGDKFNLKSKLSQYIAIGELLQDKDEVLELYCSHKDDEKNFFAYFYDYPQVL